MLIWHDLTCHMYMLVSWFIKIGLTPSEKVRVICFIAGPLEMIKNAFYFILKNFVLKILKFLLWQKKRLHQRLISKFMTSQPGQRTIAIDILPYLLWSKGNQTMKLGQSIEYNKRHIYLQKLYRKWGRGTSSRPLFIFKKSLIWDKIKCSET